MEGLLKVKRAAEMLEISRSYVYQLADKGLLPCVRFSISGAGKRKKTTVRFKRSDIERFIQEHYIE